MTTLAPPYPAEQSVDVALRDGSTAHIRPVRTEDRDAIRAFLESLSGDALYFRCFGPPNIEWLANWSVDVDYADRYGVVATIGADDNVVGHAAYVRLDEARAEVAVEVAGELHGQGVGTLMLAHLADVAARHGMSSFVAEVLPSNHKMIELLRTSGFPISYRTRSGITEVELPTAVTERTLRAFEQREQIAAINGLRHILAPRSVAVVGASRHEDRVGGVLIANMLASGFRGELYPVNPRARSIAGIRCYRSVRGIPGEIDLAVIAVPACDVCAAARDCAAAGVRALVVISAGFAEIGAEGAARQHELLLTCRAAGMRLVGPNYLGVLNTDEGVRLNATFASHRPPMGRVGFMSQSGGLGIALIESARRLGLGLSSFVSVGNKADISGNDLLDYWEKDSNTDVILLYLESFGNPRRFARVARRGSQTKPILAVKAGRTRAGARAASSHTAAIVAASDISVDALFRQAGVIRADTIAELLDTAALLSAQPLPRGRRVAVVTNAGGPGIVCADALAAAGLDVCEASDRVKHRLKACLPDGASVGNPIDMIATASPSAYREVIEILVKEDACDAIVTLFVPPLRTSADSVRREVDTAAEAAEGVTVVSVYMDRALTAESDTTAVAVPQFSFPEDAARALGAAAHYAEWRRRAPGVIPERDDDRWEDAAEVIAGAIRAGREWLEPDEVDYLLRCYGLPLIATRVVRRAADAVKAASELSGPVVLKAIASGLLHKSDVGGVQLGLVGDAEVRRAARQIRKAVNHAGHRLEGFIVQPMAENGVELLLGVVHDDSFGPLIACGAGGVNGELLGDVAVRITPLTDRDASEMLSSLRTFPLLTGYRGRPVCDIASVENVLLGLSALVEAHPEIVELDANPVIASPTGAVIADARVRVKPAVPPPPLGSLA